MKKISQNILIGATILLGMIVIVLVILTFQKGLSERPSLDDTVAIRSTIEGFIEAEDIQERSTFVTGSSRIERDLRSYLLVPFDRTDGLDQEIKINDVQLDEETGDKEAQVEQELEYQSTTSGKATHLRIVYHLKKKAKWLIDDVQAKVVKK